MNISLSFIDFVKLPTKIMAAITMACGLMLFFPKSILDKLYIGDFLVKYGCYISITFIVSLSILIVNIICIMFKYFHQKSTSKKALENAKKTLRNIDSYKKAIIYALFLEDNKTHELPVEDGGVVYLDHMMIIQKAASQHITDLENPMFPYVLQPWVCNELQENIELLDEFKQSYYKYENR